MNFLSRRDVFRALSKFLNWGSFVKIIKKQKLLAVKSLNYCRQKTPPQMSSRNLNTPLFCIQSEQGKMQQRTNSILEYFYPVLLT